MATTKQKKPKYRSGLERTIGNLFRSVHIKANHEKVTLYFTQPPQRRRYLVDFTLDDHPQLIIEAKGRFTSADRKKMLLIKEQHPDMQIIMIFGRAENTLSKKSKTTYAEWCDKYGINWVDIDQFEEDPKCLFALTKQRDGTSTNQRMKNSKALPKSEK